ncbi:hypothetical protein P3875_11460 [Myroides sp. JBRI-B21084]|uniref:hypothetical protein n=1 Tax=Myroides sp. JBRI-B21084 TaxID=3119977 RepID=UPI0026E1C105|nr:hypothetical protein [Paenimyroides cloacae]WKW46375.1 hypothetical protein P3875_11460 [Paenimyroides cloacae]
MKSLFLASAICVLSACSSDDKFEKPAILGEWQMTAFLAFIPELPEIEKGSVVWKVNTNTIEMTNNSSHAFVSNVGTFNYQWVTSKIIKVNYTQTYIYYKVELKEGALFLTQTVEPGNVEISDPIILKFER